MRRCVIFCAAQCRGLLESVKDEDFVLAADGGLLHTQKLGILPDGILGDFDSLGYIPESAAVFPVEKDDTDAMLAVRQGLSMGCGEFLIYGGVDGPRLDHTVANFQTLQYLADHGAAGYLIGNTCIITVVKDGCVHFDAGAKGILSVFCMGAPAQGVSIRGLQYPLENGTLTPGFPLGASNHFVGAPACISVKQGSLLVIYDRENGLPQRG